jgi:hypothetical protein
LILMARRANRNLAERFGSAADLGFEEIAGAARHGLSSPFD